MSQTEQILKALQKGDKLTPIDALRRFGSFRLGARIFQLKQEGWPVKTEIVKHNGKHFAQYSIPKQGELF